MQWREDEHPRDKEGKFASKDLQEISTQELEELCKVDISKEIILPRNEYAEICSAIKTKFANKIPNKGKMLFGNDLYYFKHNKIIEKTSFYGKIRIEGNEEYIKEILSYDD